MAGLSDPSIWFLLLAAVAVAVVAFFWLREQALPPVGGFGGPTPTHGFPQSAGPFTLQSVEEVEGPSGLPEHLVAVYQRGQEAPVSIEFYPLAGEEESMRWFEQKVGEAREQGATERRRGAVEEEDAGGGKSRRLGTYAFLRGGRPGEPDVMIWTQEIAGQPCGFVIRAPTLDMAKALRGQFKKTPAGVPSSAGAP